MDLKLKGKRVLITGASKGIGAAAARVLAEEGCDLRLAARDVGALEALCHELSARHDIHCYAHPTDLRVSRELARLAEEAADVDVLINNAGDIPGGSIAEVDEAAWRHAWELKVFGYINLTRLIYRQMKARGGGVIINDIGAAGERFMFDYICGSTGNAAIMAFTRTLGAKSARDNIRVVGINPGPVATERLTGALSGRPPETVSTMFKDLPWGRPAHAREIADMMAFLASERSAYTNATIITINGGGGLPS